MTDSDEHSPEAANDETSDASAAEAESYGSVKLEYKPEESSTSPSSKKFTRLACNRCHSHKLRCARSGSSSDGCERCLRANVKCVYGTPMRLGRPRCTSNTNQPPNSKTIGDVEVGDSISSNSSSTYSTNCTVPGNRQTFSSGDIVLHQHQDLVIHGSLSQDRGSKKKTRSKTKKRKIGESFIVTNTESPTLSWNIADSDAVMQLGGEVLGPVSTMLHGGGGEFNL
jgi:hypothetical protein